MESIIEALKKHLKIYVDATEETEITILKNR